MRESSITPQEYAAIHRALTAWALERGSNILGSQLGQVLGRALFPKRVKEVGGVTALVDSDLQELLRPLPLPPDAPDNLYKLSIPALSPPPVVGGDLPGGCHRIEGPGLWKHFSNPSSVLSLHANAEGTTIAGRPQSTIPEGMQPLSRPTRTDFAELARQFAETNFSSEVLGTLPLLFPDSAAYAHWIHRLRQLSTSDMNYLREWETRRSELVARKLGEALHACGVSEAKISEIVALARPQVRPFSYQIKSTPIPGESASPELAELRELLHRAIDQMSTAELRDLRVPVGTFQDVIRRRRA